MKGMFRLFALCLLFLLPGLARAQEADSLARRDSLSAAVFSERGGSNYLSRSKDLRTEVISSSGLMKMACCNLAESFENSASVTVDYSDAVTGARQIRLLGLSGIYTQMLDENRPVMRGLSAPFGLSYIPGQWLESIQIAKGSPSVINGVESMTGQINLEHRKPTDGQPLFANASLMSDTRADVNLASSLSLSDKLHTLVLGHADGNFRTFDMNGDGFADEPRTLQLNLGSRWLYYTPLLQVRWGVNAVRDTRSGGQTAGPWKSQVANSLFNAYLKAGRSFADDGSVSLAFVGDYSFRTMDASMGRNGYGASQHSAFGNLIWRDRFSDSHDLTAGVNLTADWWNESLTAPGQELSDVATALIRMAPYAEYTFSRGERFTLIAGLAAEVLNMKEVAPAPRVTVKYSPFDFLTLRANAGRGLRMANPVADNFGMLSSGKEIRGDVSSRPVEDSWTWGGNATFYFGENSYLSFDYFRTSFTRALLTDRESAGAVEFYALDGHECRSDSFQADLGTELFDRLSLNLTARYTGARAWQPSGEVREVALASPFKGVFNAQYRTRLSRWIFDFTASLTGSARVYDFMTGLTDADGSLLYPGGRTPAYPLFYAQVTRRFRGFDIYLGGENLGNFTQKQPVICAAEPFSPQFDASSVWGPLMGAKVYLGVRVTVWKY